MSRCLECPLKYRPITGSGPRQSRILFIGERPTKKDDEHQRIFIGPAGQELDETYLRLAGLDRHQIRIENCVRCGEDEARSPSDNLVRSCSEYFMPQVLRECQPEIIVLMGARANLLSDRKVKIDTHHGSPFWGSILNHLWEGWIFPSYAPSLGMHDTSKMSHLLNDFKRMGKWLEGTWEPPTLREIGAKDYALIETNNELYDYLDSSDAQSQHWLTRPPIDTETHNGDEWSLQFSIRRDSGRMILAGNTDVLAKLHDYLQAIDGEAVLHNAGQDLDTLERMGVRPPRFRDTMQESFHLGYLPQGLKPLAYQLLGVEMRSWEDIVRPASVNALIIYLEEAYSYAANHFGESVETKLKTIVCYACSHKAHPGKICGSKAGGSKTKCGCEQGSVGFGPRIKTNLEPSAVESGLRHILLHSAKSDEYDAWEKLTEWWQKGLRGKVPKEAHRLILEAAFGKAPVLGIGNCTLEEAVEYGCSDADHTGQVADELEKLRQDPRWRVDGLDRDKPMEDD